MVSLKQKKIREIWAFVNFAGSQFLSLLEERKKDSAQIAVETNGGIAIWMRKIERLDMSASVDIAIRHFFPMEIRIENTAVINVISMTDLEVRRMYVTNSIPSSIDVSSRKMTKEAMRKDFEYEIAQKLTQSLLEQGLISTEEYNKIKVLNIEKFSPFYKDLMDI